MFLDDFAQHRLIRVKTHRFLVDVARPYYFSERTDRGAPRFRRKIKRAPVFFDIFDQDVVSGRD